MPFFKSNKNKTASAMSTPAQTPRPSITDEMRPALVLSPKMTREQAIEMAMRKIIQAPSPNRSLL